MHRNVEEPATAPATESEARSKPQAGTNAPRPPRKLVLFADGTGNAFTRQESNVWRLYEALDRTRPDQIAYYIKGVGTAGWAPLAAIDGATGIGVPSNVRKLYRFVCWNWKPGDEIYIFGFSRGAFTARTLAALIASQGLMPDMIGDTTVSHAEMQRNAMAAWREYRRKTVPWQKSLPTIWISRAIRDLALGLYHRVMRHRSYDEVRKARDLAGRADVKIEFLGLFDTVEAFGVPIEELRTAIDWAIWPISFRNRKLSDKVKLARHALALDDERVTFHPIRIDQSAPTSPEQIREVWFSGVHSDVGGGYPDGTLSYVPLVWMVDQVGHRLRFQHDQIDHFRRYQSAIGPTHDSRSGAAVMYRYGPRLITETKADGCAPVVHLAVVERMLQGCDNYAPVMLPASAKVLVNGKALPLTAPTTRDAMKSAYEKTERAQEAQTTAAADAFESMPAPNGEMADQALDTVWWRRVAYFALLAAIAFVVAWPWTARPIIGMLLKPFDAIGVGGTTALGIIRWIDYGVAAAVGSTAKFLGSFLPSYVAPWLDIAIYYPFATTAVVLLALAAWRWNGALRDRIQERARLAWDHPNRAVPHISKASALLKVGRFMRLHAGPLRKLFTTFVFPGIFLLALLVLAVLAGERSYFNWQAGTGQICKGTINLAGQPPAAPVGEKPASASSPFNTSDICWASGLAVEKGRQYRIRIEMSDPWFDQTILSGVNGFRKSGFHLLALPIRRLYGADWFQPVARIGKDGTDIIPLQALTGMPADELPRKDRATYLTETTPFSEENSEPGRSVRAIKWYQPISDAVLPAAFDAWRKEGLEQVMVAEFVAPNSGELFLFVNDAIQVVPFLGPFDRFYGNNRGTAKVDLQHVPSPPLADK
jgi:uncharacterized protein (DUF2235 family)